TPPTISNAVVSGITGNSASIAWNTSENSAFQVVYGTTTAYGLYQTHAGFATSRSFTLTPLSPGTTYHYKLISWDVYGNRTQTGDQTFITGTAGTTAPAISGVATFGITTTQATISWTTDEPADSVVEYGTSTNYDGGTTSNAGL